MGRKLRQTVTALATTALAAGAIVAVFYALPDGSDTVSPSNAAASVTTTASSGTTTTSAASTIAVPALVNTGSTVIEGSTEATSDQPTTRSGDIPTTTTAAEQVSETTTTTEAVVVTTSQAPVGTTTPAAPQTTAAKTTAPPTTAPRTTAPKTTAVTTKPSTTAPKTTAPETTAPATTTLKAADFGIPVSTGSAQQVITVAVTSKAATSGTLRAWQQQADGSWTVVFGPVKAWLGKQGIGTPSESASRTPQGTYTLTQAFGALANPGTGLPYRVTTANDWWVSDVRSPEYNTWQTCAAAACPFNTKAAEHLKYITPYYDYAVVMDVNRSPVVAGGGSAFFLHVSVGAPTEGCVAIDKATLVSILRWLDPAQHPRIAVGVG